MKRTKCEAEIKQVHQNSYSTNELILMVIASILFGLAIGFFIGQDKMVNGTLYDKEIIGYKPDKYLTDFISVYENVNSKYYEEVSKQKLVDAAIEGMLKSLDDPHSVFMNAKETKGFDTALTGNYLGIGVVLETDMEGYTVIGSIFPDTPASKAGLKIGDRIIKIDDKVIDKEKASIVANLMRNDKYKKLTVSVLRASETIIFNIEKAKIEIPSVTSEVIEKGETKIGHISINIFANTTPTQMQKAINELEAKNVKGLIVDVRDNGGGYLESVDKILSLFMTKKDVIYQVKTLTEQKKYYASGKSKSKMPVVILVNENSASASEIMAAAFAESYGAKIVGVNTYGKGTVQEALYLKTGGMYKFTTQLWLTPLGNSINKVGIKPDYEVELKPDYLTNPTNENDNQLQKALEVITQ